MKLDTQKLQMLMAEKCIEIRKLAKKTGLTESTISKIKNGHQNAKPITIGKIAKALDVPVSELIGE